MSPRHMSQLETDVNRVMYPKNVTSVQTECCFNNLNTLVNRSYEQNEELYFILSVIKRIHFSLNSPSLEKKEESLPPDPAELLLRLNSIQKRTECCMFEMKETLKRICDDIGIEYECSGISA